MRKLIIVGIIAAVVIAATSMLLTRRDDPQADLDAAMAAYGRQEYGAARALLRPLADRGMVQAQYQLGRLYEHGEGVERDNDQAARWYRLAADQGHGWAIFHMAQLISYGYVKLPDIPEDQRETEAAHEKQDAEAAQWYRRAAEAGVAPAQSHYALLLLRGRGVSEDADEAVRWVRLAAIQGDPDAQYLLGDLLHSGDGVARNDAEAAQWYLKAVVQQIGSPTQMSVRYELLKMWRDGTGPWPDADAFVSWLTNLANLGDVAAQLELARMYEEGDTAPRDIEQSTKWYVMAAVGNTEYTDERWAHVSAHVAALRKVAGFYLAGDRLPKDPQAARQLLIKAGKRDDIASELLLGALYMDGDAIPRDDQRAYLWFDLALRHPDASSFERKYGVDARGRLDELVKRMSPPDLEAARANAAQWHCRVQLCTRGP